MPKIVKGLADDILYDLVFAAAGEGVADEWLDLSVTFANDREAANVFLSQRCVPITLTGCSIADGGDDDVLVWDVMLGDSLRNAYEEYTQQSWNDKFIPFDCVEAG